eukprot:TRINITY_DN27745_c0_g1_i1.p1 TRINITY_DN27745_c0_g1~~TRINITY_DN27745_c0_g1_i1.p1  ORF type:complete len:441 (+),score=158.44 TRINITY_DN27745_c0_g1_i1:67-1389(+)
MEVKYNMLGQSRGGTSRGQQVNTGVSQLPQLGNMGVHMGGLANMGAMYGSYSPTQGYPAVQYEGGYSHSPVSHQPHHQPPLQDMQSNQGVSQVPTPAPTHTTFGEGSDMIVEVWADQLEEAFEHIRHMVVDYPYVAMDTEFPGVVARPVGNFKSNTEFYYQTLRCNVNLLKIIQLGITFSNEEGNHPPEGPCTWQFNFKFDLKDDIYAQDSIDLLTTSGIDFTRFARDGIDVATFAELLTSSGLVLSADPPVKWLSFHAGYDFGYLIKVLTSSELPKEEDDFFELMDMYFPVVYDVKYLLKHTNGLLSEMTGLNKLGEGLSVKRIGPAHQAGSDSLLTSHCFFKLRNEYFSDAGVENHCGVLYGLGQDKGNENQNSWANPSITPSTPANTNNTAAINTNNIVNNPPTMHHNGAVAAGQFPSSPSLQLSRGPQPGLYNSMR